ncbi:MAG: efflux transporter outer membrane subunit [Burkholderiaceae bacterium]|nr:efflux transporter outer membrane subunit [Burkholderiaceae bacterium]
MKIVKVLPLMAAMMLTGCVSMSPFYDRPEAPVASAWPQGPAYEQAALNQAALPDWEAFYTDSRLREVIKMTLANNRDYRVAMLNVERLRQAYNIQRSEFLPYLAAAGEGTHTRTPESLSESGVAKISHTYSANLAMASYELDLFGRIKSLSQEALNRYFATEEGRKSARVTLIAETANLWLKLGADRSLLDFAKMTLESQEKSFQLSEASYKAGAIGLLELNQAKTMLASAQRAHASAQRAVAQDLNAMGVLVGTQVPEELLPVKVEKVTLAGVLPQGAPSEVLLNRPDIAAAEYALIAANANIGAARAAFFPRITLIGAYGSAATDLGDLFTGGTRMWSFVPSISLPIFTGGAAWAAYQVSQRDKEIAIANYEKAIQVAFKEVADAMATEGTIEAELKAQADLASSTKQAYDLAQARYQQGASSFLEVLDSQRQWVSAQTGLVMAEQARAASLVTLYKTLGGGAIDAQPKEAAK